MDAVSLRSESNPASPAWNAIYQATVRSPIFAALRLAAEDIDALARQVADRCVSRSCARRNVRGIAKRSRRAR
ncbi:MAG: hypothetical protein QM783_12515 [Phycisphaerales bacterium]